MKIDPEGQDPDAYDVEVLKDSDLDWLTQLHAVGIDYARRPGSYFFSGVCHAIGSNWLRTSPGEDNDIHPIPEPTLTVYYDHGFCHEPVAWPVHRVCYQEILRRCITQNSNTTFDRASLCDVLEELECEPYTRLRLDYGKPSLILNGPWRCIRGEEVLIMNPVEIPQLDSYLDFIRGETNDLLPGSSENHMRRDIFDKVPAEIRLEIFKRLPVASVLAVKAASPSMNATVLPSDLLMKVLRADMPWLWELQDTDTFYSGESVSRLSLTLLDLFQKSHYKEGTWNYIPGLVNRRRIWEDTKRTLTDCGRKRRSLVQHQDKKHKWFYEKTTAEEIRLEENFGVSGFGGNKRNPTINLIPYA
ncbi:hypothetical protein ABOM_011925 [Aspergillus bombycis]|uniref:F-box domain-containing protein n=1 Tax=Aspergillus bombycis TaxID=109264 RepID=A0A1F7ZJ47_9EURO|nr:hypothetical protein ABOM_011925 [Aspergillus bombycis]OGM39471.1 hypothetical protein ABOM_011925 [Aspergillus bombycis]